MKLKITLSCKVMANDSSRYMPGEFVLEQIVNLPFPPTVGMKILINEHTLIFISDLRWDVQESMYICKLPMSNFYERQLSSVLKQYENMNYSISPNSTYEIKTL